MFIQFSIEEHLFLTLSLDISDGPCRCYEIVQQLQGMNSCNQNSQSAYSIHQKSVTLTRKLSQQTEKRLGRTSVVPVCTSSTALPPKAPLPNAFDVKYQLGKMKRKTFSLLTIPKALQMQRWNEWNSPAQKCC